MIVGGTVRKDELAILDKALNSQVSVKARFRQAMFNRAEIHRGRDYLTIVRHLQIIKTIRLAK